ncbi:MAG TPA: hypothetical protein VMD99_03650 [Terriglobales bacterium]|nr:hypothetical protein [Terriglobales bacterium]
MTSARLLVVAILLCSVAGFAQESQSSAASAPSASSQTSSLPQHADAARPLPDDMKVLKAEVLARLARANLDKGILLSQDGQVLGDGICYTIRSYVVARDSKDSDSVHLVSYSTCQMASRYQLRTTQARPSVVRPAVQTATQP